MERRKTTIYLDADVLTAAKVLAAARQQSESQVVEEALRAYLDSDRIEVARGELRELMDRVAARSELTDEQAMDTADSEVHAARAARRSRRSA
jgi:hypothetical protein